MARLNTIRKVEFYKHNISETDIARAAEVLRGPFLSTGQVVEEFERKLANYLGLRYVIALSSCTAALHLSLQALGIGQGDEVITTPMTFMATSNAILYTGAVPVFVDVNRETGLINPEKVYDAITSRTKGIVPVHLYGQMCDMEALTLTSPLPLMLLEDAAHCIEGTGRRGHKAGCNSNGACFSFYPTKSITSGEGGAFATNNKDLAGKVERMRNHGMTKGAHERYNKEYQHWDMEMLGYNYRMSNIQAALLLGQLDRIGSFLSRRSVIWKQYEDGFRNNPGIEMIKTDSGSARLMFTILVRDRDIVLHKLQDKGVGVAVNYRAVHLLDYYRKRFGYRDVSVLEIANIILTELGKPSSLIRHTSDRPGKEGDFPNAEYIGDRTITLPLYPKLTDSEVEYVIEKVNEVVG